METKTPTKKEIIIPIHDQKASELLNVVRFDAQPESELTKKFSWYHLKRIRDFLGRISQDLNDSMSNVNSSINDLDDSIKQMNAEIRNFDILNVVRKKHNNRSKIHLELNKRIEVIPSKTNSSVTLKIKQ